MCADHPVSYEMQKAFGIGTPLHEAAGLGKLDVVDVLLARGADPNVRDVTGELAIDRARRNNRMDVVERLRGLCLLNSYLKLVFACNLPSCVVCTAVT